MCWAPAAASAGAAAAMAPRSASGAVRPGVRFQTASSWPAPSRREAIGVPISPRPRNAIFDIRHPPFFTQGNEAGARRRSTRPIPIEAVKFRMEEPTAPLRPLAQHVGNLDLEISKRPAGDTVAPVVHHDVGEAAPTALPPRR